MNVINKIKINFYPELRKLNIDDKILKQIISNKRLNTQYRKIIKPFIKYLKEYYKYSGTGVGLDYETIEQHLKAVFELSIKNNSNKYISFIRQSKKEDFKISNFIVINDNNFEKLYSMIGNQIFDENICQIVNEGYSERLILFINDNKNFRLEKINSIIFDDRVWNIVSQNFLIGDTTVVKFFETKINTLVDLINKDFFEGMKYTYENIPESRNYIKNGNLGEQFSMDFIEKIGKETLKKLYAHGEFSNEVEYKIIFKLASFENYELIQDLVAYKTKNFDFSLISVDDMRRPLLEFKSDYFNKQEIFLNKYLAVEQFDVYYIKIFINAINKINNLPIKFKEKYGSIIQLLNRVFISTNEELVNMSKSMNSDKRREYRELIEACEKEGNNVLKNQFISDLKIRHQQILDTAEHKEIKTSNGNIIDVYELTGQPFAMLVHAVVDNPNSSNNSFVNKIVNNPENWDKMNGGNKHISTSLISNKYMVAYGEPNNENTIMFGFYDLPWNAVKFTDAIDAGLNRTAPLNANYNMRNRISISKVNTITTVDDLIEKTIEAHMENGGTVKLWNEVGLSRIDETTGMKFKPNFIVCMDRISENSKKAAQYFNIPIYLIKCKYYKKNNFETTRTIESAHLRR